jgi:hypothetical protein
MPLKHPTGRIQQRKPYSVQHVPSPRYQVFTAETVGGIYRIVWFCACLSHMWWNCLKSLWVLEGDPVRIYSSHFILFRRKLKLKRVTCSEEWLAQGHTASYIGESSNWSPALILPSPWPCTPTCHYGNRNAGIGTRQTLTRKEDTNDIYCLAVYLIVCIMWKRIMLTFFIFHHYSMWKTIGGLIFCFSNKYLSNL